MATKLDKIARLTAGLEAVPEANSPPPKPAAPRQAPPATEPVNLRMPAELRAWYVREAARRQADSGKAITAQQLMLEALAAWKAQADG